MSTEFKLKITMDPSTHKDRRDNNLNLILMKVVKSTSATASSRPLSWICLTPSDFSTEVEIRWTESYRAYTSKGQILSGANIHSEFSCPIKLGEQLAVTDPSGIGEVIQGKSGSIIINNSLPANPKDPTLICGIMQSTFDTKTQKYIASQLCAFPLLPNSADFITPVNKVFVYFASDVLNTGAVIEQTFSQGIMVDFTGASEREIEFDRLTGWGCEHPDWSDIVPPGNVIDKLIQSSTNLLTLKSRLGSELRETALKITKEKSLYSFGMDKTKKEILHSFGMNVSKEFKLKITMDEDTYADRKKNGLNLVLMKAVKTASHVAMARPLSWICLTPDEFSSSTDILWKESYFAYTSVEQICSGGNIYYKNVFPVKLGQQLEITDPFGMVTIKEGKPGSITISNPLSAKPEDPQLTCGVMQSVYDHMKNDYVPNPVCAFPLPPLSADLITPINKVFAYFASEIKDTGVVIDFCLTQGIMVDFIGAIEREIHFNRLTGWSLDYPEWSEIVPPGNVVDKLIIPSTTLAMLKNKFDFEKRQEASEKARKEGPKSSGLSV